MACGHELRVKEGSIRPKMRLTCKCGQTNEIGRDLCELSPDERIEILIDGLEGKQASINTDICSREIGKILQHGSEADLQSLRKAIPRLRDLAKQEQSPNRESFLHILADLRDTVGVKYLQMTIQSAPNPDNRRHALRALGRIFYEDYIHPFLKRAAKERLEIIRLPPGFVGYSLPDRRHYEEYEKAHNIIYVEFIGGDEETIGAIGAASIKDPDDGVRWSAVHTLRGLKHQSARVYLEKAKTDSCVGTQEIAQDALAEFNEALGRYSL